MQTQDRLLSTVSAIRDRAASRRGMLRGAAIGGGALALAGAARFAPGAAAQDAEVNDDILSVLNYALTLEHLENAFYRDGLASLTVDAFTAAGFQPAVVDYLTEIGAHEAAHVATLTEVITQLGGTPVAEGTYDFGTAFGDVTAFLATAAALENTGVDAYTGAAQYLIDNDQLLTAALTIHGVEARHAAYLNVVTGESPFPDAVDAPLTPAEVVEIAGPFIVEAEVVTPNAAEAAGGTTSDDATPEGGMNMEATVETDATVEAGMDETPEAEETPSS